MDITATITDAEKTVLESWLGIGAIESWVQHALNNKVRQRVDASILEETQYNPKVMTTEEKMTALAGITLPTKAERDGTI